MGILTRRSRVFTHIEAAADPTKAVPASIAVTQPPDPFPFGTQSWLRHQAVINSVLLGIGDICNLDLLLRLARISRIRLVVESIVLRIDAAARRSLDLLVKRIADLAESINHYQLVRVLLGHRR